jgi:hypothetical protein
MTIRFEVEVGVVRALETRGLFRFYPDVATAVEAVVTPTERAAEGADPATFTRLREHLHLAAAEYALIPAFDVSAPVERPVPVTGSYARLGPLKWDCTLLQDCWEPTVREMGPDEMTVFSSDAMRVTAMLGDFRRLSGGPGVLHDLVFRLEDACAKHPSPAVGAAMEGGALRLQGLLWRLQLTVGGYPGYEGPLEAAVDDSRVALGLA